jgi:hypothetical protein
MAGGIERQHVRWLGEGPKYSHAYFLSETGVDSTRFDRERSALAARGLSSAVRDRPGHESAPYPLSTMTRTAISPSALLMLIGFGTRNRLISDAISWARVIAAPSLLFLMGPPPQSLECGGATLSLPSRGSLGCMSSITSTTLRAPL